MRRIVLPILLLVATPLAHALPRLDAPDPGPLGIPTLDDLVSAVHREAENATGQNLTREDVLIAMDLDFRKLDFDAVGLVFGGGTFEAQGRLSLRVELRALRVERMADMLREKGVLLPASALNRTYLAADAFRLSLAGEALAAFESEQERRLEALVAESFPEMTILSSRFGWSNVDPAVNGQGDADLARPRLTEPPVVLEAVLDVQHLQREKLTDIIAELMRPASHRERVEAEREEALLERLKAENAGAFYEQSAFGTLGITQLIPLQMEPGWDLVLALRLPEGYTIEYASPDVEVAPDRQEARVLALAGDAGRPVANPIALSLSNRYLVSVALLAAVLVLGGLLRIPVLAASHWLRPGRRARWRRLPGWRQAAGKSPPLK